jgi:hypothetical protein
MDARTRPPRDPVAGMGIAPGTNLGLRFFVELGAYAALAYRGAGGRGSMAQRTALAVAAPLLAVTVWTLLLAPKARWHLSEPAALVLELVIFTVATIALIASRSVVLGTVFGVVALANTFLVRILRPDRQPSAPRASGMAP